MAANNHTALSPSDFETLAADLLRAMPKQRDALIDKLLELLAESGSNLLQAYQGGSIEWFNRPDTFCAKLTKLWRVAMGDPQQASVLAAKLQDQLPAIQDWPALYEQGGIGGITVELLEITWCQAREIHPAPGNAW